jgi:hypothetical protein
MGSAKRFEHLQTPTNTPKLKINFAVDIALIFE